MEIIDRHGESLIALLCTQQSDKMPHCVVVVIRAHMPEFFEDRCQCLYLWIPKDDAKCSDSTLNE